MLNFLQMIEPLVLVVHFIVSFFLILVILLQAGKGADMGAAFGAGSSQTLFGARGAATFLSKMTTVGAMVFLVTSISLAAIHKGRSLSGGNKSVVEKVPVTVPVQEVVPQLEEVPTPAPTPVEEKK